MNTRIITTAALAAACGLATACGSDDETAAPTAAAGGPGVSESFDLTLVTGVKSDEFYVTMGCGAKAQARKLGVNLNIQGPDKFDASLQTPIVNAVAARKPDGVLISPTDAKAMYVPIKQLADRGTKIALVDTTLERSDVAVSRISSNNELGGRRAAEALLDLIGGKGKVAIVNVKPGISTTDARSKGFRDELEGTSAEFVGEEFNDDDPAKAAAITKSLLAKHPDLKGIFATNVLAAEGVASGLREAGKASAVKVVTFDAGPKNVEDLRRGLIQALIAQKPFMIGGQGVKQLVHDLRGKGAVPDITTGFVTITKNNIDDPKVKKAFYTGSC